MCTATEKHYRSVWMDHPAADYSSALHLVEPREPSPVVIEVPHASTWIEAEASQYSSVQARCAAFDADLYVGEQLVDVEIGIESRTAGLNGGVLRRLCLDPRTRVRHLDDDG